MSDSAAGYYTRDVLLAGGTTAAGDSLFILVCHLPSKLGGDYAEKQRMRIVENLLLTVDTVAAAHPMATVVVMGDFNADIHEPAFCETFGFADSATNPHGLTNLMYGIDNFDGTHNYGGHWTFLDQIMVKPPAIGNLFTMPKATVFNAGFLLEQDNRHATTRPFRTYRGLKYLGGFSDHLPVYIDF